MKKNIRFMVALNLALSVNLAFGQTSVYHEIPLTIRSNIILISLTVNNQPATFIVDTGASVSLLDKKQASKYDFICFDTFGSGEINSLAGINSLLPTSGVRLKYEYIKLKKSRFYGSNFEPLHKYFSKRNIHVLGIVGADFLIKNNAVIDYKNKKLILNM